MTWSLPTTASPIISSSWKAPVSVIPPPASSSCCIQRNLSNQFFYLEQVDIVYKPLILDEITRKIRHAMHQKNLRQAEEELRRMKQEAFRIFLG